jgi:hypothetical protein
MAVPADFSRTPIRRLFEKVTLGRAKSWGIRMIQIAGSMQL